MTPPDWFKIKKYPHIGLPRLSNQKAIDNCIAYITNQDKIKHHSFLPLIRRTIKVHKASKKSWKIRNLTYASHWDALIYSYYAYLLQNKYEEKVKLHNLDNVAVAYRKIKCDNNHGHGNKCNIHFAFDTFSYVREKIKTTNELAFITFDITGFFDNLNHSLIKTYWTKVLGNDKLPDDVYAVFKNVTKYSYVKEGALFSLFKNQIICKTNSGKIKKKKVSNLHLLRRKKAVAFCEVSDISLIRKHRLILRESNSDHEKKNFGIPQGLPISAVLANVYMLDFDIAVNMKVSKCDGLYKRYSDDIVIVCPYSEKDELIRFISNEISKVKLEIQSSKTNVHKIYKDTIGNIICENITTIGSDKPKQKPIEYLGFSFDGSRILLKNAGLCKYYKKMRLDIAQHKRWASIINNETRGIHFVNQIVRRFTYAGSNTFRLKSKNNSTGKQVYHGNFLSYVKKSAKVMHEKAIKQQLRKNLHKVNKSIEKMKE